MGRIKTQLIKRVSHKLIETHPTRFKKTFEENKQLVTESADIKSKKL